jgi:hypothetical protein
MLTLSSLLRFLGHIGLFMTAAWSITQKQFGWLLYVGFPLLLIGVSYILIDDWRSGRKKTFWMYVLVFTVIMTVCLVQTP